MYQNYVVEVKKTVAGEFEHNVSWVWDEDADTCLNKAYSKFHEILARAAVSDYADHGAIIFSSQCFPIDNKCYRHTQAEQTAE